MYNEKTHLEAQSSVVFDACFLEEASTKDIILNNSRNTVFRDTRIRSYMGKPNIIGKIVAERLTLSDKYAELEILGN
ncbi:MAG: hypothetical protein DHS20C17_20110 [Cyclobacteriaceae bacterium]|nr:MAG: hypothetical protein DHS20C17_20110 [Cyclobacteriaceae bacterium]